MGNIVELIKADHDKVEQLYQHYQGVYDKTERKRIVEQICQELEIHAKLEESLFYPAVQVKMGKDGTDLVKEAVKEHNEMKRLISQLQTGGLAEPDFDHTVHALMRGVQHHVKEEEGEMLPAATHRLASELDRLGAQMEQRKQELVATAAATAGHPGHGTLAQQKTAAGQDISGASTIEQSIDVNVPVRTAYNQWTQFETFPRFMEGIVQVTQLDDTHLHWKAAIGGKTKEWDAVITEQLPDERIAWTNTTGARNAGVVTFHRLADKQTRIMLQLEYEPEGVVENAADWLGVVSARVRGDLRRFKEFIEAQGHETGAWRETVETRHQ